MDGRVDAGDVVDWCAATVLDVPERWTIRNLRRGDDAESLAIGPGPGRLPSSFTAELDHAAEPLLLGVSCKYQGIGHRIDVDQVTVTARNGRTISPRDLSAIELARAVFLVASAMVESSDVVNMGRRPGRRPTPEELSLVADLYSWHFVAWGAPARAVMDIWGIPRSTANRWLRSAREMFPAMPGDGGGTDGID